MDPNKWKSVAVPINIWAMLKEIDDRNDRSVGGTISYITKREQLEARRARQKKDYWKHRDSILEKKKKIYWLKKYKGYEEL